MSATPTIDIGIGDEDRQAITDGLSHPLADTYTLYLKTHNYHWNVTGPMFQTLHLMFEAQYNELSLAVDLIAERIRALGAKAPGSYTQFAALTSVSFILSPTHFFELKVAEVVTILFDGWQPAMMLLRNRSRSSPARSSAAEPSM